MELKLNIYEKRKVVKTYTAETYDLMFGTVEDFLNVVDMEGLTSGSDVEVIKVVGNIVMKSMDSIKELLKDVFDGITDEELKRTRVSDIAGVLVDIVKYAIIEMGAGDSKN